MIKNRLKPLAIVLIFCLWTVPVLSDSNPSLMMATTTSMDNTGLLDYLAPQFISDTGIMLKWTATGTGKALKLGENCDVDILMVHAPAAERKFLEQGFGIDRREIMYNDFVIIGPAEDLAGIAGESVIDALRIMEGEKVVFVSRGDQSGTHKKELFLWESSGILVPEMEKWYVQTGQGMLATINVAAEKRGYTMTDRGTYIKYAHTAGGNPALKILVEKDAVLENQYSVMTINIDHCSKVDREAALKFTDWITGDRAQQLIGGFRLLGKALFIPNAK